MLTVVCLLNAAITTAATLTGTALRLGKRNGYRGLVCQATVAYGSGGTTIDVTVQTSLDSGVTWCDIWHCTQFTTASARRAVVLPGETATSAAADIDATATLAAAHSIDGLLGDQVRAKVVSVGTYAGTTVQVDVFGDQLTAL
jgi:hypothetical protein